MLRAIPVIRPILFIFAVAALIALGTASAQTLTEDQARTEVQQRRETLTTLDRTTDPIAWGVAQSDLAASLHRLWDFASVQQAVIGYRAALEVLTPQNEPAKWLEAQEGLGQALLDLARRRGIGTFFSVIGNAAEAQIDPGLDARDAALTFTEVLRVRTLESDRTGWVRAQVGLADSLAHLAVMQRFAGRVDDVPTLQSSAEAAYLRALTGLSRDGYLERGFINQRLSLLYEGMAEVSADRDAMDEVEFRRIEADRIRLIRSAIRSARTAETEYRRAGRQGLVEEARERRGRLREQLRPNEYW